MSDADFNKHMNRLASVYSKGAYPSERILLINQAVGNLTANAWGRVVDNLIAECATPPMLPKIREVVSIERDRNWANEKKQHAQDAKDFYGCNLMPEESKIICQYIVKRIQKQVSDRDWTAFMNGLTNMARHSK